MVAGVIRDTLRPQDMAGRLGGEEFCLRLPGTDAGGAMALAGRLRAHLTDQPVATPSGVAFHVTFSAGVVEGRPGLDEETLLRRADEALYAAKAAGRDRVLRADAVGCAE